MPPRTRGRKPERERTEKPKSDVYTGLLVIAFLAMLTGVVLLYMDYSQYPDAKPQIPQARPPAGAPGVPNPPPGPPGGNPVPPGGNPMPPGGNPMPPGGMP